jgi:hypothetical protein
MHVLAAFRCAVAARQALEEAVAATYQNLFAEVALHGRHVVRCWNFIPGIQDHTGNGLNRYMVFNAGRHRGYRRAAGTAELPDRSIATASGVGTEGDDLFVAALGSLSAGVPIENPRQVPAFEVVRYGPPPCFTRHARARHECRSPADLEVQVARTRASPRSTRSPKKRPEPRSVDRRRRPRGVAYRRSRLSPVSVTRVYVVDDANPRGAIGRSRGHHLSDRSRRGRLCRPELLVEIEGVVSF